MDIETPPRRPAEERPSYHHGDLRRALLDEMAVVVREDGVDAVSLRALARRVGVAPSAAFRHFKDKRALFTAFATEALAGLVAKVREMQAAAPPGDKQFEAIGRAYITFAREDPGRFRAMCRRELIDVNDPDYRAGGETMDQLVFETLSTIAPHTVKPTKESDGRGLLAWAAVHGLVTLALDGWIDEADPADPLGSPEVEEAFCHLGRILSPG